MRSSFFCLLIASLFAALVGAQTLPPCVGTCFTTSMSASGGCASTDLLCLCKSGPFQAAVGKCLQTTCTSPADISAGVTYGVQACSAVGVTVTTSSLAAGSSGSGGTSTTGAAAAAASSPSSSASSAASSTTSAPSSSASSTSKSSAASSSSGASSQAATAASASGSTAASTSAAGSLSYHGGVLATLFLAALALF